MLNFGIEGSVLLAQNTICISTMFMISVYFNKVSFFIIN